MKDAENTKHNIMQIKKAALILMCAVFFISCGKKTGSSQGVFSDTADADPQKAGFTAINEKNMQWEFYETASGKVSYSGAFEGTVKTDAKKVFSPQGMVVAINGLDGSKREVIPAYIGEIAYSKGGRYLCFTMRLGTSPNTTAGIFDTQAGSMAVSFELADRKLIPGERSLGIAMKRIYRRPRVSDSGAYFACSEFESAKASIGVYTMDDKKKITEIEAGEMAAFMGDDLYYVDLGVSPPALMKRKPPFSTAEKIGELEGRLIDCESDGSRLFFTTTDYLYKLEGGVFSKAADLIQLGKGFEIFEVVTSHLAVKNENETYLFLTVKRYSADKYTWRIYTGRF